MAICQDYRGQVFKCQPLKLCSFRFADLRDAHFIGCDLTHADFRQSLAYGVQFTDCILDGADFSGADLDAPIPYEENSAKRLKRYQVEVEVTTFEYMTVEAFDQEVAKEKAYKAANEDHSDCDGIEVTHIKEIQQ